MSGIESIWIVYDLVLDCMEIERWNEDVVVWERYGEVVEMEMEIL